MYVLGIFSSFYLVLSGCLFLGFFLNIVKYESSEMKLDNKNKNKKATLH